MSSTPFEGAEFFEKALENGRIKLTTHQAIRNVRFQFTVTFPAEQEDAVVAWAVTEVAARENMVSRHLLIRLNTSGARFHWPHGDGNLFCLSKYSR